MAPTLQLPFPPIASDDRHTSHLESRERALLDALREQLLSGVAYELRSPLTILQNALEILDVENDTLSADEFDLLLRTARRGATRLLHLMHNLDTSRAIQSGRLLPRVIAVDLALLVEDALTIAEDAGDIQPARFTCHSRHRPLLVVADRRLVAHVLVNLLIRAAKHTPAGKSPSLRVERKSGYIRVTIEDRGPETSPPLMTSLPGHTTLVPAVEPGLEFSLSLAKGVVEAHGGCIGVESAPGAGTRVWLDFPEARSAPETS